MQTTAGASTAGRPNPRICPSICPWSASCWSKPPRIQRRVRDLDPSYQRLFRNLVLTTAWQESCWRHYVVSDDRKLVPLRSGSGDVGLMQINERVWRGFYDQQRLRWDIDYNSSAGAEVLIDYLLKYAIRKGEHQQPGGISNLARASYSAYNGGPESTHALSQQCGFSVWPESGYAVLGEVPAGGGRQRTCGIRRASAGTCAAP
jgi:hypothetical protein